MPWKNAPSVLRKNELQHDVTVRANYHDRLRAQRLSEGSATRAAQGEVGARTGPTFRCRALRSDT